VLRRRRFAERDLGRQLDLFVALTTSSCSSLRQRRSVQYGPGRARTRRKERFGDYQELVETGTEILAGLRDNFAQTLDDDDRNEEYEAEFNRAVVRSVSRASRWRIEKP
jgi:hypothetical protein